MDWERIDNYHQRAKVPGGWVLKAYEDVSHWNPNQGLVQGYDYRISMCFIPDPDHTWWVEKK